VRAVIALSVALILGLCLGCATAPPKDVLTFSADTLERRNLQTRRFDGISEEAILAASAGVLQDLGFNLDESEATLGVIVASKQRTAREPLQMARKILLQLFLSVDSEVHDKQRIRVALVSRPADKLDDDSFQVRVTFQRVVWNTADEVAATESIDEPDIYQQFFERLSQSVFLEAHQI